MPFYNQNSTTIISTWDTRPQNYTGFVLITDVGVNGSIWYSNGTSYTRDAPTNIGSCAIPVGLPPAGNVGANGALTLGALGTGSLVFSATSGAGVVCTGTGTAFAATDVGRGIVLDNGKLFTVTAFTSATSVTGTITGGTLTTTSFANGTWRLTFLFQTSYTSGIYLYFNAGRVYAGSPAGLYYVVMSTTYSGTIFNNIYDTATNMPPELPDSPIAISSAAVGEYTTTTSTAFTLVVLGIVVGGTMGKNGALGHGVHFTCPPSSNNKTVFRFFGANLFYSRSSVSPVLSEFTNNVLTTNRGITNRQVTMPFSSSDSGTSSASLISTSVNTDVSNVFRLAGQIVNANDFVIIERANLNLIMGKL